jgi:hypothetical protein
MLPGTKSVVERSLLTIEDWRLVVEAEQGIFRWAVGEQELACVSDGDEQKNVRRELYEKEDTQPPYDNLPTEEEWRAEHPIAPTEVAA